MTINPSTSPTTAELAKRPPSNYAETQTALPAWTPELAAEMEPFYERVKHVVTPMEWPHYAPLIKAINELKKERNAVVLAHN